MKITDKICIITGSAQGLGKAIALKLLEHGAKVCISDVNASSGQRTLEEFRKFFGKAKVCFIKCDVTKQDELINLFDEAQAFFKVSVVDMLVNNAGINTNLGWKKCMEVNIIGVLTGTDIAMERMKSRKQGCIINVASLAGIISGTGKDGMGYFESKHAVVSLTRTLAADFNDTGIEIKCLCPSWMNTQFTSSITSSPGISKNSKHEMAKSIKSAGGLLDVEYVAQGFIELIKNCGNGAVLGILNNTPFFLIPDTGYATVFVLALTSRIINKITRNTVIGKFHQTLFILIILIVIFALLHEFLHCVFPSHGS